MSILPHKSLKNKIANEKIRLQNLIWENMSNKLIIHAMVTIPALSEIKALETSNLFFRLFLLGVNKHHISHRGKVDLTRKSLPPPRQCKREILL